MKIRIKGNSVRFRLTKTEVSDFETHGVYRSETKLLGGVFRYRLQKTDEYNELAAEWIPSNNEIVFFMPIRIAEEWTQSDEVGFQNNFVLPDGTELFLLVEKDFVCLDNTFEDQSDNYPNPNAVC